MGFLSGIFGSSEGGEKESNSSIPWIALNDMAQLDEIEEKSKGKPQVIFKHSTSCGVSRMVLNMFKSSYGLDEGQMHLYFLDLLAHRDISNEIATKFETTHQSPQLLIIKNGVVVHHDSHGAISDIVLKDYL